MYIHICVCMHIYTYTHTSIYIYICLCVNIICIHTLDYTSIKTQTTLHSNAMPECAGPYSFMVHDIFLHPNASDTFWAPGTSKCSRRNLQPGNKLLLEHHMMSLAPPSHPYQNLESHTVGLNPTSLSFYIFFSEKTATANGHHD